MRPSSTLAALPAALASPPGGCGAVRDLVELCGRRALVHRHLCVPQRARHDTFTYTFDLRRGPLCRTRRQTPRANFCSMPKARSASSPARSRPTAPHHARHPATLRRSDGNPVVILGYFFTDGTDHSPTSAPASTDPARPRRRCPHPEPAARSAHPTRLRHGASCRLHFPPHQGEGNVHLASAPPMLPTPWRPPPQSACTLPPRT